jgi:hypothetical protein
MKRLISVSFALVICVCLLIGTESRAMAYVDPGTGLLALQSVGSAAAATAFFLRRRIMAFFTKKEVATVPLPVVVKSDSRKTA